MRKNTTRKPLPLAFARQDRLMSIHEDENLADARASTFLRGFVPWQFVKGTRNYHAFDVVITGDNPLLAAILLRRAADLGLDAAVTKPAVVDEWPYDLAMSLSGGALVLSSLKIRPDDVDRTVPAAKAALKILLKGVGRSVSVLPAKGFSISAKHPEGEIALYPIVSGSTPVFPPVQLSLVSALLSSLFPVPEAPCLPDRKTAVFARRLILTAMPAKFSDTRLSEGEFGHRIRWVHGAVTGVGTALTDVPDGRSAAKMMVEDILRCSRAIPLEGLVGETI